MLSCGNIGGLLNCKNIGCGDYIQSWSSTQHGALPEGCEPSPTLPPNILATVTLSKQDDYREIRGQVERTDQIEFC